MHRKGLTGADVSFRAVRIYVFTAMDLETELIKHYASPEWNNSGFGSNDPGRRRDLTYQKEEGFDSTYPVDIDLPLSVNIPQTTTAQEFLLALREAVPYTVRWERPQPDLNSSISWQAQTRTMRETMVELLRQLPAGWQATVLAGRIILYKEIVDYAFGMTIARST